MEKRLRRRKEWERNRVAAQRGVNGEEDDGCKENNNGEDGARETGTQTRTGEQ